MPWFEFKTILLYNIVLLFCSNPLNYFFSFNDFKWSERSSHTEHTEGHGGLPQTDVVLAGRHLTAVFSGVLQGDGVDGQGGSLYLGPRCIRSWGAQKMKVVWRSWRNWISRSQILTSELVVKVNKSHSLPFFLPLNAGIVVSFCPELTEQNSIWKSTADKNIWTFLLKQETNSLQLRVVTCMWRSFRDIISPFSQNVPQCQTLTFNYSLNLNGSQWKGQKAVKSWFNSSSGIFFFEIMQ